MVEPTEMDDWSSIKAHLHVSLKFLQKGDVFVQPCERFAETCGQGQYPRGAHPLVLHELLQFIAGREAAMKIEKQTSPLDGSSLSPGQGSGRPYFYL